MNRTVKSLVLLLGVATPCAAHAQQLKWTWNADESLVKNSGFGDGSTDSPATGGGYALYDPATNLMTVSYTWDGLLTDLTKLHMHGPATPDQSNPQHVIETFGPPDPPVGLDLQTGSYRETFELVTLTQPSGDLLPSDILQIMTDGLAYVNYHTEQFGTGEIRGNLGLPTVVPEPAGLAVMCLLLLGIGGPARSRGAGRNG
ncbi:CHRD domain protein [Pseudobythopirellula maris]|uniref:CHRD domain protein n=1 Tax=Pseudobythopirellula maris TaxID=2527991 RepID=A0A5C5ZLK5_9BACT|nr:CHRD domain-containing protein [Pseudobythopirellula maris]TWT87711.1 CHRD domain protein [Pseudobythopirellula maris]